MRVSIYHYKALAPMALILIFTLGGAACGANNTPEAAEVAPALVEVDTSIRDPRIGVTANFAVRPIEEVFSEGPPVITDVTGSDATLIFVSDIPLACSVVYGETPDYGRLTLDQDMAGGAHTDHHPLILNLKPDTLYHYRLQGSAEDGTIYMSEDMTFRTPPAEETAETNLASIESGAQVIAVSSNFGGATNNATWGADSALDGSRGTEWSSAGDGNDAYIEVALAGPSHLHAIEVWTRMMSNNTAQIFEFTLTTDSGQIVGPFTLPDANQAYRFEVDITASTLRLDVIDSNGGNTGLVEFAAYGTPLDSMGN